MANLFHPDGAFWTAMRNDPICSDAVGCLRGRYESDRWDGIPVLSYGLWTEFLRTGDRAAYEALYFRRRRLAVAAALLSLIDPENAEYLSTLQEILWAICDEYAWALPAHAAADADPPTCVDLFAADTAAMLAETAVWLSDRLDARVVGRVRAETRRRVFDAYRRRTFWWETSGDNWTAVCVAGVGIALMRLEPDAFRALLPRLSDSLERYLASFPSDGTCLEGVAYWQYGFGNFVCFADALRAFDPSAPDLLADPRVPAVATFPTRTLLKGGATVSNADGSRAARFGRWLTDYLSVAVKGVAPLPQSYLCDFPDGTSWVFASRALLWYDLPVGARGSALTDCDLPQAGQAVRRRASYDLFVKAGHNGEPHNHNDVGSFIVATEQGQVWCDLGSGLYTRDYFSDKRYTIFCNASRGHDVPIVGGREQQAGSAYCGALTCGKDTLSVSFAAAYGLPALRGLTRTFVCADESLTLTDVFAYTGGGPITERFVTPYRPEPVACGVRAADSILTSLDGLTPTVTRLDLPTHTAGVTEPIWTVDFEAKDASMPVRFRIACGIRS